MKIYNIFRSIIVAGLLTSVTSSCSDWLAVDMEDSIMEEKLFETNDGYLSVLNGIYTKMNEQYSNNLSMGTVDVMAQLYNIGQNHNSYTYSNFNFDDATFESMSGSVWTGLYSMIANVNTLLEHCDKSDSALKPKYKNYVKGEALALRAMLHFDLLRLYGPIYSSNTENTLCMPYQATTSKDIQPLESAKGVMAKVLEDLNAASELLKDDAIRTNGVMNSESEDPNENTDLRYRQYRLNYYAVQGLLARAYQWMGDKENAYKIAKSIITENTEKKVFPWTAKSSIQGVNPDRIFSTEVMFGLYDVKRANLYDSMFKPTASFRNCLTFDGKTMAEGDMSSKINWMYSDVDDLRRTQMWSLETLEEQTEYEGNIEHQALCFNKYADISTSETRRYMVPLLRMSEIYLIAAETCTDLTEAMGYVNAIRANRNCVNLGLNAGEGSEKVQEYVDLEFARETIGEGQIFFNYKRHSKTSVLGGSDYDYADWFGADVSMNLQNYVWPMPKVEKDKRTNN